MFFVQVQGSHQKKRFKMLQNDTVFFSTFSVCNILGWHEVQENAQEQPWRQLHPRFENNMSRQVPTTGVR